MPAAVLLLLACLSNTADLPTFGVANAIYDTAQTVFLTPAAPPGWARRARGGGT